MRFSAVAATILAAGVTAVSAATHVVAVGKDGSLKYDPPSVTAKAGDVIEFQFLSKNHTITQSTFDKPCVSKDSGVDSGYQFIPAGTTVFPSWSITVQNDTAPLWFYCAQGPHCAKGMVFAVNPTAEKTFEKFHASALATDTTSGTAGGSYGGAVGGGMGGGYGGASPGSSTTSAAGGVIALTTTGSAPTTSETPAANAAPNAEAGSLTNPGNGALGRSMGSWKVVVGAVVLGALAL